LGVNTNDIKGAMPALKELYTRIRKDYKEKTHPKLKILDSLIVFCLVTFVIQVVYGRIAGKDPFNSLLAGAYCSLG
jgi:hypothetical protein